MLRRVIVGAVAVVTMGYTNAAWAWWSYAKWGMTEQQVIAAARGKAEPCGPPVDRGICARFISGDAPSLFIRGADVASLKADVTFFFDGQGRLNQTVLRFNDVPARQVLDQLVGAYGSPADRQGGAWPTWIWRDAKKGTVIKAMEIETRRTQVIYLPVGTGL